MSNVDREDRQVSRRIGVLSFVVAMCHYCVKQVDKTWTHTYGTAGHGGGGQSSSRCQGEGRGFESRLPLQAFAQFRHLF